jgi:hypothetical protein
MRCNRLILVFLLFALSGTGAFALVSRSVQRSFPVAGTTRPVLKMSVFYGSILVEASDTNEFQVQVFQDFEALNEAEADKIAKNLTLGFDYSGTTLNLTAEYTRNVHWTFENWPPVKLRFTIKVPKTCDLDLYTRDGAMTIGLIAGRAKARTHYGQIFFKGVDGDVEATSEFGDIVVSHCTGALKLRSISGSFLVGPVTGFADVFGYGGEIEVQSAGGGIKAETSGADLSVGFHHPIVSPATLKTGGANIILTFDKRSACDLNLRASFFGKVLDSKNSLPLTAVTGALGKSRVQARLNEGGPKINARASGGYIYLQARPTE